MLEQKPQDSSFQDGVVKLYRKQNVSRLGDMPKTELVCQLTLRFRYRTVGMQRYYTAKQNQERIDEVIRCPAAEAASTLDIARIFPGGKKYLIRQVQRPEGSAMPVMDLALERLEDSYEID